MLVMLSSVTTRKTPGMRMTHHELRRSARSANANMLPHESTSTGRPSPRKLKVASIAMLVLMLEMTTNMIADTKFGMRCLRMMKGNRAPMQREARMYSLLRICRTSLRTILAMPKPYSRIGELPELVQKVKTAYDSLLDMKREEVAENIRQCMQDVHQLASEARDAGALLRQADDHFVNKREAAKTAISLTELDAMITQLLNYKDTICRRMEVMSASRQQEAQKPAPAVTAKPGTPAPKPPKIMTVRRYDLCSVKRLQSKEDIDKYVEAIREKLMKTLESCDGVQIN